MGTPENDKRSAQDIIDSSPLLKNLGNQSHVKDMLKEQVGDFERDPDAAFRAAQVLDHVVRFDENGQRLAGNDVDNSSIDGFTKGGEAKHGTEAGRLQDFGKGGFDSLKGTLTHASDVGGDAQARKDAEAAGIVWELPKDDKRSAQDIIDANPLLKNLGNQSGVKDALKERVGDFDTDANAAFRASQVLDRVVGYNEKGEVLSGGDVANSSIDGFTKGGEAKHGTEAGRLQDFGKYGFSQLAKPQASSDITSYKDYLKANPDADAGSRQVAQYAAILDQKYDSIRGKTGAGDALTEQNIKDYKNANPQLSQQEKEALDFFSQPGAFRQLDTASASLGGSADGKANRADITTWLSKEAPKDAAGLTTLMQGVVSGNITSHVDTSKLGKDVFEHPGEVQRRAKGRRAAGPAERAETGDRRRQRRHVEHRLRQGGHRQQLRRVLGAGETAAGHQRAHQPSAERPGHRQVHQGQGRRRAQEPVRGQSGPERGRGQNLRRRDQVRQGARQGLGCGHQGRQDRPDRCADQLLRYRPEHADHARQERRR
nr:type III effector HrpK domain-containing protein [Pseudomonas sp. KNUC1026]